MQVSLVGLFALYTARGLMLVPDVYAFLKGEIVIVLFCHDATSSQILDRYIISKPSKILIIHFQTNKILKSITVIIWLVDFESFCFKCRITF